MFAELFQEIQHPEKRQILTVNVHGADEISALCSAFLSIFPDALFFSDDEIQQSSGAQPLKRTREYLGLTTSAIILDIREGFSLDYFLSISATIAAGGILVLIKQEKIGDAESQRFHDEKIPTPFFHDYLERMLQQYAYIWKEDVLQSPQEEKLLPGIDRALCSIEMNADEQQSIIDDFEQENAGIFTLFSTRGSGKSWLGAKLIARNPEHYILTAPNQNAIEQYRDIEGVQFRAPDALFLTINEGDLQPETLIIEEAAKMPLSHLERLCRRFQKILMISSVENYEGTGQGLREKIQDLVVIKKQYQLQQLKRFIAEDPLRKLCQALMLQDLLSNKSIEAVLPEDIEYQFYDAHNIPSLRSNIDKLRELYHLLNNTHYQTNIQDLRRLFDAPSQVFILAYFKGQLIGAIWAMKEGGLSPALTEAVFNGLRRPKGNLVAQMLTGQSYFPEAMGAKSVRISRISVVKPLRRLGIGQQMVHFLEEKVRGEIDFISVSFGLTRDLLQFWESMGYQMAHLGFHLDKTTGLHSAVVLKNLSSNQDWIEESFSKFAADTALNIEYREYRAEILEILQEKAQKGLFDQRDQAVISASQNYQRAKHTVENALLREKTQ